MNFAFRAYVTGGTALVGAGIIAASPVTASPPDVHLPDIALTADEEITLDLVRHGETQGPTNVVGGPAGEAPVPGPPLDETGVEQANAVALAIQKEYGDNIAGIYAGSNIRMPETAMPLAHDLGMQVQPLLPGLTEIAGGIYQGEPLSSPAGILYELTLAAWAFGLDFVQMPGAPYPNGVVFEDSFDNAVQTIYDNTVTAGGPTTDVAVSGEAAITTWTLMNVNNPDLSIFLPLFVNDLVSGKDILPNVGQVVIKGEPGDWTLVSFNGQSIPPADLLTSLFVDVRSLITAPQTAAWHIYEAILGGDPTTIENAIQTGFSDVGAAIVQFPQSVINDIIGALSDGTATGAPTAGESLGDALSSLI
jgi:hypothetical protein